jgi:rod shape-determining protein MreC
MKRIYYLIRTYSKELIFLLLELAALQLIFNPRLASLANRLNSSRSFPGHVYNWVHSFRSPLSAPLLHENALLREALANNKYFHDVPIEKDNSQTFTIIPAAVINNSIIASKNYITLDAGAMVGIEPGMGVFGPQGVVGIVKNVSENFSTVISLLHTDALFSAKVYPSGAMGTLRWKGDNPRQAQLVYIPSHVHVSIGDSVITSGYGTAFYEGIPIGIIRQLSIPPSGFFYDIVVDLHTNFSTLSYVYVVNNRLRKEQDSLEQTTKLYYE